MADIVDDIWGVILKVIIVALLLALCIGFLAGQARERKQVDHETDWRTVQEGRLCNCTTNGLYRIQIKEN